MKTFKRTDELEGKLFLEALNNKNVIKDAKIRIVFGKDHYRAYCNQVNSFLQFPKKLRSPNTEYIADIIEVKSEGRSVFYRAVKGTIRKFSEEVVG